MADEFVVDDAGRVTEGPHRGGVIMDRPEDQGRGRGEDQGRREPDKPENDPRVVENRRRIKEIEEMTDDEAKNAEKERLAQELKQKLREDEESAKMLKQLLINERQRDREKVQPIKKIDLPSAYKDEVKTIQSDVIATLDAVRANVIKPPGQSKIFLTDLANRVSQIPPNEFILLHDFVQTFIDNDVMDPEEGKINAAFLQRYEELAILGTETAHTMWKILASHQSEFNLDANDLKKFNNVEIENRVRRQESQREGFEHEWQQYFATFYENDSEGKEIVFAISSPQAFLDYVESQKKHIRDHYGEDKGMSQEEIEKHMSQLVSERVQERVKLNFAKLTKQAFRARPTEVFQEIVRKGFPRTIEAAVDSFARKLTNLVDNIDAPLGHKKSEEKLMTMQQSLHKMAGRYVTARHDTTLSDKEKKGALFSFTVTPTHQIEQVTYREYLEGLDLAVHTEYELIEYFHNVQTITVRGGGGHGQDGGHFAQMSGHAEHLTTLGIDTIPLVVDSDIVMSARQLYLKFLRGDMAFGDWVHSPGMFTTDYYTNKSPTLQAVYDSLHAMYPKIAENPNERWRFDRALNMAVGISFGLTLDEWETAGMADAPVLVRDDKDAEATAHSFYRGDSRMLAAFDPYIDVLRFHAEDMTIGPLLYAMLKQPIDKDFDHRKIYDNMQLFKQAFREGDAQLRRKKIDGLGKEAMLAIDEMKNFFEVGSIFYRGTWRDNKAIEGWMRTDEKGLITDVREAWKSVKYIGTQPAMRFLQSDDFKKGLAELEKKDPGAKNSFFEDLYKQYIEPVDSSVGTFTAYYDKIRDTDEIQKLQKKVDTLRGKSKSSLKPGEADYINRLAKEVDASQEQLFLSRVIAGMMMRRTPMRFMTLERTRKTEDGKRMWEKIRQEVFPVGGEGRGKFEEGADKTIDDIDTSGIRMNRAVRDVMIVEERLRNKTSEVMKKHLDDQRKAHAEHSPHSRLDLRLDTLNDSQLHDLYNVDESTIRRELLAIIPESVGEEERELRINDAIEVYKTTIRIYRDKDYLEQVGHNIKNNKYRFTLGNDDLDWQFLAYRNAGERPHARAIADTSRAEEAGKHISGFEAILQKMATVEGGKFSDQLLIDALTAIHDTVKSTHSLPKAAEKTWILDKLACLYFRTDANSEKWWKLNDAGRLHSVAAEFAASNHVWQWDTQETFGHIEHMKIKRLVPGRRTYKDLGLTNPFDYNPYAQEPPEFSAENLEKHMRASRKDLTKHTLHTFGPLAIFALLYYFIKNAAKEEETAGRGR